MVQNPSEQASLPFAAPQIPKFCESDNATHNLCHFSTANVYSLTSVAAHILQSLGQEFSGLHGTDPVKQWPWISHPNMGHVPSSGGSLVADVSPNLGLGSKKCMMRESLCKEFL